MEEFILQPDKKFLEFLAKDIPRLYDALPDWKKHNLYANKLARDSEYGQQPDKTH